MRYRKYITITDWRFWAVMWLIALTALGFAIVKVLTVEHIADENGPDDPAVTTMTLEQILSTESSYMASVGGSGGYGEHSGLEWPLEQYDWDRYHLKYRQVSGIMTLQATLVTEPVLVLDFETILTAGNLEIVILIDGVYDRHVDVRGPQTVEIHNAVGKTVVVRMAAEGAEVELTVSRR